MKLDPGIHIVMHSVFLLKPGVTLMNAIEVCMRLLSLFEQKASNYAQPFSLDSIPVCCSSTADKLLLQKVEIFAEMKLLLCLVLLPTVQ